MFLVWDNAKAFKRHIEAMDSFRRSHDEIPAENRSISGETLAECGVCPALTDSNLNKFTDVAGNVVLVPIWEIEMPSDARN